MGDIDRAFCNPACERGHGGNCAAVTTLETMNRDDWASSGYPHDYYQLSFQCCKNTGYHGKSCVILGFDDAAILARFKKEREARRVPVGGHFDVDALKIDLRPVAVRTKTWFQHIFRALLSQEKANG
jgi:hypothetical protein